MREFYVLKLLDLFQFVFRALKIDYPVMRRILQVKLVMDDRKPPTFQNANKPQKETQNGYLKSLWIYVFFGLILIPLMSFGDNYIFQMTLAVSVIMFLVMSTLIAEFSSVLLDVRDKAILSTKPISVRTANAAKILHICIYLFYLTIAITGIPLIVTFVTQGILFGLLAVVTIVLVDLLIVVFTAIFYIAILSVFDGEKLKDMINYVQIGLALGLMVGYQVVIRAFSFTDLTFTFEAQWWHLLIVPMWFAAPFELFFHGDTQVVIIIQSILAVVLPFVAIWLYVQLVPTFERNLEKLLNTSKSKVEKRNALKEFVLSWICRSKEERAFYRFSAIMMKQERDFKLKVYPSLGFSIVIPFIFIFNSLASGDIDFATSKTYFFIYASLIMIPSAITLLSYSAKYKAAWIYQMFPLTNIRTLKTAALKAFLVKLFVPMYAVMAIVFVVLYGVAIIPNLVGVFLAALFYATVCDAMNANILPFTQSTAQIDSSQGMKNFVLLIPLVIIGAVHVVIATYVPFGAWLFLIIAFIANAIGWKYLLKV